MRNTLIFVIFLNLAAGFIAYFTLFGPLILLFVNIFTLSTSVELPSFVKFSPKFTSSLFIYLVLIIISLVRTNIPDMSRFSLFVSILNFVLLLIIFTKVCYIYLFVQKQKLSDFLYDYFYIPLGFFVLINFVFWILGFKPAKDAITGEAVNVQSMLMKYLGVNIDRVQFPFGGGFNGYASIVAVVFLFSLVLFAIEKRRNLFVMSNLIISFFSLLLIDSRSSLFYPILIFIYLLLVKNRKSIYHIRFLILWFVFGPLIMIEVLPAIANISFFEELSRNNSDLLTGNSRFIIWGISFLEFYDFKDMHVLGYGEYGHFASGASLKWSFIFNTFENSELKTPHNTLIVTIFDIGYVGLAFVILVINKFLKVLSIEWKSSKSDCFFTLGYIIFFLLIANTETMLGRYGGINFTLFLFMAIAVTIYSQRKYNDHLPNNV